jgi:hypothetical protein
LKSWAKLKFLSAYRVITSVAVVCAVVWHRMLTLVGSVHLVAFSCHVHSREKYERLNRFSDRTTCGGLQNRPSLAEGQPIKAVYAVDDRLRSPPRQQTVNERIREGIRQAWNVVSRGHAVGSPRRQDRRREVEEVKMEALWKEIVLNRGDCSVSRRRRAKSAANRLRNT